MVTVGVSLVIFIFFVPHGRDSLIDPDLHEYFPFGARRSLYPGAGSERFNIGACGQVLEIFTPVPPLGL